MAERHAEVPTAPVQIESFTLTGCELERADSLPPGEREIEGQFDLSAHEPEDDRLRVDLTVRLGDEDAFRVSVTYVVVFKKTGEIEDGEEAEKAFWRSVGEQLAPIVVYPYVRETITTLMQKANLPVTIPPIVDFGQDARRERSDMVAEAEDVD